jgi:DNA-binding SARP family transcriptional activator
MSTARTWHVSPGVVRVLQIYLLGRPRVIARGERLAGPRGRKAWALLAVLLLSDRPLSRRRLADLLFPDADDPLGALRWSLSQLRRAFTDEVCVEGDPVVIGLASTCWVDVRQVLARERSGTAETFDLAPGERLLAGADGLAGEEFDLWLIAARHRVDVARRARLRTVAERTAAERTVAERGATADPSLAVVTAANALVAEPDDLTARGALIGSLAAAGDHRAALSQLRQLSRWIRQELQLSELLADGGTASRRGGSRPSDPDVVARIELGRAAMGVGGVLDGLSHLRDAVRLAGRGRDERLQGRALFTLGSSVVHGIAVHSAEGAQALREAARLAQRVGDYGVVAEALRDLAFVANAGGRQARARRLLADAVAAAGDDRHALSSVRGVEGMFLADRGQHRRALVALRDSARLAESTGHLRQAAWSISFASRSLLQRCELEAAQDYADRGHQLAVEERWTTILPWMDAFLGELDLAAGRGETAERRLRHAWSVSQILGDWTWQAMAARGLGMVAFARGDAEEAVRWLDEATSRAARGHDRNPWVEAFTREALCRVVVAAQLPRAEADLCKLAVLATSTHQPDFMIRAREHQAARSARRSN